MIDDGKRIDPRTVLNWCAARLGHPDAGHMINSLCLLRCHPELSTEGNVSSVGWGGDGVGVNRWTMRVRPFTQYDKYPQTSPLCLP